MTADKLIKFTKSFLNLIFVLFFMNLLLALGIMHEQLAKVTEVNLFENNLAYFLGISLPFLVILLMAFLWKFYVEDKIFMKFLRDSIKSEKELTKIEIAQQVAHDIRSPLAALEVVMEDLKSLPADTRDLTLHAINRIQDIADNLSKQEVSDEASVLVTSALHRIVNEKKVETKDFKDLKINLSLELDGRHFLNISASTFMRILSNILNNSIEAMNQQGSIKINAFPEGDFLVLNIQDHGPGFPAEILESGISKGNSTKASEGRGLGLHYTKEEIIAAGGEVEISNQQGAVVTLKVPFQENPPWFTADLNLRSHIKVLFLDDDQAIHDLWKKVLKKYDSVDNKHVQKISELKNYPLAEIDAFFIDFDLDATLNGIEVVEQFNLPRDKTIIVTSNYLNSSLRQFSIRSGVKVLPKQLLAHIGQS